MDEEGLELLRRAGRIARRVREKALELVREGAKLIEICEALEGMILKEGAKPAFPCNICVNDVAAHYTPPPGDGSVIPPRALVKVDVGVSVDGYIADTAATVALDPSLEPMAEAARAALLEAVRMAAPGVPVSEIGAAVQRVVGLRGFRPIKNLTGHEIARYNLHAGLSIPNIPAPQAGKLQPGHIYAIEPFVTSADGAGEVVSARQTTIYRLDAARVLGMKLKAEERRLAQLISERFDSLPYTPRWIPGFKEVRKTHERMVKTGRIHGYPVLVERRGRPVAQAEHTILITEDGCEVIT